MKKVILTVLLLAALAAPAQAAVIKQNDNEEVSVSGTLAQDASGEALVAIVGPFDERVAYSEAIQNKDKLYVNAAYADKTGAYSFTYEPKTKNKFYAVSVTSGGKQETAVLYLAENSVIKNVLKAINDAETVKTVFENPEYKDILITNYKEFEAITSDTQKKCIYEDIDSAKKTGYATFEDFEKVYTKATAVQSINNCETAAEARLIADDYLPITQISLYNEYKGFSEAEKNRVFERMLSRSIASISDFYTKLNESVFLEKIQNEAFSTNLTSFIKNNASEFSIDTSEYTTWANSVNAALNKNYYKTMSDFKTALAAAITAAKDSGSGSGSSSGGGGGGGGSSSGIVYVRPTEPAGAAFNDLESVSWAREAILALKEKNIVSGKGDGSFCPNDSVTREEFTKMVVGAFGIEAGGQSVEFTDVSRGSWYYDAVTAAAANGVIYGISDSEFGVGIEITRQDIAAILNRIAVQKNRAFDTEGETFADDWQIAEYARQSVYALRNGGIVSGFEDNSFRPLMPATRAEAAVMIYKMTEALK